MSTTSSLRNRSIRKVVQKVTTDDSAADTTECVTHSISEVQETHFQFAVF